VRARHAGLVERVHSAPPAVCTAEAAACVRVDKASFARSPKCNTLVDHRHALVLEQMRARVIDLLLGSSQDHHPGTCQVPRHRLDDVPGDVLAHRHACSHALQPDCWLRAPCRRKLSATASQLVFDACNAAWLGGGVLATRSSPSTHSALCVHRGGAICCLLAGLGDVRLHVQVDPSSCGSVVELDIDLVSVRDSATALRKALKVACDESERLHFNHSHN